METFKQYLNEVWQPGKDDTVGGDIKGVGSIQTSLKNLYDISLKFPIEYVHPSKLKSVMTNYDDKEAEGLQTMIDGEIKYYADLSDEQKQRVDQEEEKRIVRADYTKPLIVVGTEDEPLRVLDGNHRLAKAIREGASKVPVRFVPPELIRKFVK